jgi:hypothetical protein
MRWHEVQELIDELSDGGVRTWLHGGWSYDVLEGRTDRTHTDVDFFIPEDELGIASGVLEPLGFLLVHDARPTRCVYRRADGAEVDIMPVRPQPDGSLEWPLYDGGSHRYTAEDADGVVVVDGREVRCFSATGSLVLIELHRLMWHDVRWKDARSVRRLARLAGVDLPAPYRRRAQVPRLFRKLGRFLRNPVRAVRRRRAWSAQVKEPTRGDD